MTDQSNDCLRRYESLDANAQHLARVLAHFGTEPVPVVLVKALGDVVSIEALEALRECQFLVGEEGVGAVPGLVGEALRGLCEGREELEKARGALLLPLGLDLCMDPESWEMVEPCVPHALAWWEHVKEIQYDDAESVQNVEVWYLCQARYDEFRSLDEKVKARWQASLDDQYPDVIIIMINVFSVMMQRGDLAGAQVGFEQMFKITKEVLGEGHRMTLVVMSNLALTMKEQGDLSGSIDIDKQVLEVRRKLLGEEDPSTLISMSNLALAMKEQGDLAASKEMNEQALEIRRRVLGANHPDTMTSIGNLVGVMMGLGDVAGAKSVIEDQKREVAKSVLGVESPDTLTVANNLRMLDYIKDNIDKMS